MIGKRLCIWAVCAVMAFTGAAPALAQEQEADLSQEPDLLQEADLSQEPDLSLEILEDFENEVQAADIVPELLIDDEMPGTGEEIPGEKVPVEEVPVEKVPGEEVPIEEIPAEETPDEDILQEDLEVQSASVEDGAGEVIPDLSSEEPALSGNEELLTVMVRAGDEDETETEFFDKVFVIKNDAGITQQVLIETYLAENGNEQLVGKTIWASDGSWSFMDPDDGKYYYFVEDGLYDLLGDDIWNLEVTDADTGISKGAGGYRIYLDGTEGTWAYFLTEADIKAGRQKSETLSYDEELPAEFYIGVLGVWESHDGLVSIDGAEYYLNTDGSVALDKDIRINGYMYHFGSDGKCTKKTPYTDPGWELLMDGAWHWRNEDGTYITKNGFYELAGSWYYIDKNGARKHGWMTYNKKVYYLDPETGKRVTGLFEVDGATYYHSKKNGWRLTGIIPLKGGKFYFAKNGKRSSGFVTSGGKKYYFSPRTFKMRYSWIDDGGFRYYAGKGGVILTGAQTIKEKLYVFDTEGKLVKNDKAYRIGNNYYCCYSGGTAAALTELQYLANSQLKISGWTVNKSFNWITANYSEGTVPAKTDTGISDLDYYAMYGLKNKKGDAFVMAAVLCLTAEQIGKEAHLVEGYVSINGNRTPSAWVEIVTDGKAYIYDPYYTFKTGKYGKMLTYGGAGTWNYADYRRVS